MLTRPVLYSATFLLGLASWSAAHAGDKDAKPAAPAAKQEKAQTSEFLRVVRDADKEPVAMEAAIVTYVPRDCGRNSPTVDLVGAVHIGEKTYYAELNRAFEKYDAVLYELVAPEGTRIPKGGKGSSDNPVSMIQNFMTDVLDLEFQLRGVDYTKANFVHADLSPEQFAEAMRKRGDSVGSMILRMWGYAMARQGDSSTTNAQLLTALFSKNRSLGLKRALAEQFQESGGSLTALEGPDGSAIIADRNRKALAVLRKEMDGGKKTIAIFYGAGHMPDMDKHLREDFGLTPINTRWLVAWDLKDTAKKPATTKKRPAKG